MNKKNICTQTAKKTERKAFYSEYIGDVEPSAHIKFQQYEREKEATHVVRRQTVKPNQTFEK